MGNLRKDPDDVIDFWFDWGSDEIEDPNKRLLPDDENITAATVTILDDGLTEEDSDFTDKIVRVRVSGGVLGSKFRIKCVITTNKGKIVNETKTLEIKERVWT